MTSTRSDPVAGGSTLELRLPADPASTSTFVTAHAPAVCEGLVPALPTVILTIRLPVDVTRDRASGVPKRAKAGSNASVTDDGRGFGPAAPGSGTGHAGMRDRMDAVRGSVTVTAREGDRTCVEAALPAPGTG
jgi:hypothetical protein